MRPTRSRPGRRRAGTRWRIRKEQLRLKRARTARIRDLGASVYAEDGRADELKAEAKALDELMERNERELARTIAGARRRVRHDRAAVATTQVVEPEHEDPSDG